MPLEFSTVLVALDNQDSHNKQMQALAQEGWMLVPGITPQAIYQLCRQPGAPAQPAMTEAAGQATLSIDESKITILRGGKPVA